MKPWPPISREDLRSAAHRPGFDSTFPVLIRRLIAETAGGLVRLDMPGEAGTSASGFDGVSESVRATAFVPEGTTVWELSVGGGQSKANADYAKRADGTDGLSRADVTYVEVILVPWSKARTWSQERSAERLWKRVEGYNLDRVHAWLDSAPATTVWLAGQLGLALPGVTSASVWWNETWLPSTVTPLDADLVLAGRESAGDELLSLMQRGQSLIELGGDLRPDETRAFVSAALTRLGPLDGTAEGTRTLFVSDVESLNQLLHLHPALNLVLLDSRLARDLPTNHEHRVVLSAHSRQQGHIEIPRINAQTVEDLLRAGGLERDDAFRMSVLARRSLLALRRALAKSPSTMTPRWAEAPDLALRRFLLLGAWVASNYEDRGVVARMLRSPYEEAQERALAFTGGTDVPYLGAANETWFLLAAQDAWNLIGPSLIPDDLQVFGDEAAVVLREINPVLELEPSVRWRAGITGVQRRYSGSLREGIARSLAFLGAWGSTLQAGGVRTGADFASTFVHNLLEEANGDVSHRLWTSLCDVLCHLAEAAPDVLLQELRKGLSVESPFFGTMLREAPEGPHSVLGPTPPHVHFLGALELIAWSEDHVEQVVEVLADLHELDRGGARGKRPFASLVGILNAWAPNTSASLEVRKRILRRMMERRPSLGAQLLIALVPDELDFQSVHPSPQFRDWGRRSQITVEQGSEQVRYTVELLLSHLGADPQAYVDTLAKVSQWSPEQVVGFAAKLSALSTWLTSDADRLTVFEPLRALIAQHVEHSNQRWAMPVSSIEHLSGCLERLSPKDPVLQGRWLFTSDPVTLGDVRRRNGYQEYEQELLKRQAASVSQILVAGGLPDIRRLADTAGNPWLVGRALAEASDDLSFVMLEWLGDHIDARRSVAAAYLESRLALQGTSLLDWLLVTTEEPGIQADVLRLWKPSQEAWARADLLGRDVAREYWSRFLYYGLGQPFVEVGEAADRLLEVERPAAALHLICLYGLHEPNDQVANTVILGLEMLAATSREEVEAGELRAYEFSQLFGLLYKFWGHLDTSRVVQLEWQFFQLLGFRPEAPNLRRALLEEPGLYVDVVSAAFRGRRRHEDSTGDADEPVVREMRMRAFGVLRAIRRCPGWQEDGSLDPAKLKHWIIEARRELHERDRADIGDEEIGSLLAWAPVGEGGNPIPAPIRDLLEELESDELELGLYLGIRNRRGTTTRGVLEGGGQESVLAGEYRAWAQAVAEWPRSRRLLDRVAGAYESDARREGMSAEMRHLGLGR